jgi:DNA replication ATP-dependent helicase/nuclease Dna2
MLHEIMQSCLASGNWGPSFLEERIEHVVRAGLERLVRIDVGIEEARVELRTRAQGLAKFSQKFIRGVPRVCATIDSPVSFLLHSD